LRILLVNKFFHPAGGPEKAILQSKEKLESLGNSDIDQLGAID